MAKQSSMVLNEDGGAEGRMDEQFSMVLNEEGVGRGSRR